MNLIKQIWRLFRVTRRAGGWKSAFHMVRNTPQYVKLVTNLLGDPRVSPVPKVIFAAGIIYAISPLNFIPWYFPILGPLDDIGIALFAANFLFNNVPAELLADHRQRVGLADGRVRVTN
jgi:uncharacterized membrane protein YkvA (DUF1232 family)